jgi:hypothetical protein
MTTTLADVEQVAPYVRDLTGRAFMEENARRQADRDPTKLTLSGLGGCTRAAAYKVAGTPPSDRPLRDEARAALLGTGTHDWFLPALVRAAGPGAACEQPVVLHAAGLDIAGTLDFAHGPMVLDLKTVREWRLTGVRRRGGAYDEHTVQVLGYVLARIQEGHDVRYAVFLYMDRSTGEVEVIVEEVTNAAVLAVVDRVTTIARLAELDPDSAPREERGPGLSYACDRCPWLRRCWGEDAVAGQPGPQRRLADTPAGLELALTLYAEVAELEATARARRTDKDFAKLILNEVEAGEYGRWRLGRGRPRHMLDQQRARQILEEHGLEVPEQVTEPSLSVRPRKVT